MTFFRRLLASAALLGLSTLGTRAQDSTLTRLIGRHQYPLQPSGGSFSGPGWDKLLADVRRSQFVLVGEDHGMAQIPLFTAAVAREFRPAAYVGEIDSYVAQKVTELAVQPGEPAAYLRQNPGALAFATMAEEYELLRQLRTQNTRLVGIDQVFSMTAAPFYAQLAGVVKGKAARLYFAQQARRYQAQDQENERQNQHYFALSKQTSGSIDSLLTFTKNESLAAQKMAQDYVASYRIYKSSSHQRRLDLMKRNLLRELQPYQTAAGFNTPPILFKLGGFHLARGLSPIRFGEFYDVGNLVQNLADVQDKKSLHVLVLGKQGRKLATFNLANTSGLSVPYTEADYNDEVPIKTFTNRLSGPAWASFDLRPLRDALTEGKLHVAKPALERIILGYDYLIIIPETTASRPM